MHLLTEPLFKTLFDLNTPRLLLKADAPNFTILQDNDSALVGVIHQQAGTCIQIIRVKSL
jgi:hypothetical protein